MKNVEVRIEWPDTSGIPVTINFFPLKNERAEVTGAITSFMSAERRRDPASSGIWITCGKKYRCGQRNIRPAITERFSRADWLPAPAMDYEDRRIPPSTMIGSVARRLMSTRWFVRSVVLNQWSCRRTARSLDSLGNRTAVQLSRSEHGEPEPVCEVVGKRRHRADRSAFK